MTDERPIGDVTLRWPTLAEVLRLRCPVCWQAPMFAHPLKMHARCTSCGHSFDRGNGYFLGAMFMSYALVVLIEVAVIAGLLLAGLGWWTIVIVAAALVPVIGPLVAFPYSRVIWVMIERRMLHWGEEDDAALRQELTRRQRARTASSEEEAT